jgi:hypothetical protein
VASCTPSPAAIQCAPHEFTDCRRLGALSRPDDPDWDRRFHRFLGVYAEYDSYLGHSRLAVQQH